MKKIILTFMLLLSLIQAKEHIVNTYTVKVEANSTKANGESWDIWGGSPDILVKINGIYLDFNPKCQDSYRCSVEFTVEKGTSWYFEIYDRDLSSNDLIAKGECSVGKECQLKGATISIK